MSKLLMEAGEYQVKCADTAQYPDRLENMELAGLMYSLSGLTGEAGELVPYFPLEIDDEDEMEVVHEFGDVSWYMARGFYHLDMSFQNECDRAECALFGEGDTRPPHLLTPEELMSPELALVKYACLIHNDAKKVIRDDGSVLKSERRDKIVGSLRRVLEAWMMCLHAMGMDYRMVLYRNNKKLSARNEAGTIQGDGDNR